MDAGIKMSLPRKQLTGGGDILKMAVAQMKICFSILAII
jgi:hypothetical protein